MQPDDLPQRFRLELTAEGKPITSAHWLRLLQPASGCVAEGMDSCLGRATETGLSASCWHVLMRICASDGCLLPAKYSLSSPAMHRRRRHAGGGGGCGEAACQPRRSCGLGRGQAGGGRQAGQADKGKCLTICRIRPYRNIPAAAHDPPRLMPPRTKVAHPLSVISM